MFIWYNLVLLFPAVSCSPPDLIVPGKEHLLYSCPTLYTLGSTCTMSCSGGYPFAGANQIECAADQNKDLNWRWDPNALQPFCKGTNVYNMLDSKLIRTIFTYPWAAGGYGNGLRPFSRPSVRTFVRSITPKPPQDFNCRDC